MTKLIKVLIVSTFLYISSSVSASAPTFYKQIESIICAGEEVDDISQVLKILDVALSAKQKRLIWYISYFPLQNKEMNDIAKKVALMFSGRTGKMSYFDDCIGIKSSKDKAIRIMYEYQKYQIKKDTVRAGPNGGYTFTLPPLPKPIPVQVEQYYKALSE